MLTGPDIEPRLRHLRPEIARIVLQLVPQRSRLTKHIQHRNARTRNGRSKTVGKKIRPAALPQHFDDLPPATREAAAGTAKRLAQGPRNNVDPAHHPAMLMRT